jgi:hypothetical protein
MSTLQPASELQIRRKLRLYASGSAFCAILGTAFAGAAYHFLSSVLSNGSSDAIGAAALTCTLGIFGSFIGSVELYYKCQSPQTLNLEQSRQALELARSYPELETYRLCVAQTGRPFYTDDLNIFIDHDMRARMLENQKQLLYLGEIEANTKSLLSSATPQPHSTLGLAISTLETTNNTRRDEIELLARQQRPD